MTAKSTRMTSPLDTTAATTPQSSAHMDVSSQKSSPAPREDTDADPDMAARLAKLKRLLDTSAALSSFIQARIKTQTERRLAEMREAKKEEEDAQKKNANGKRPARGSASPSKRAKLEDAEGEKKHSGTDDELYMTQPASVTGATLRDYQLAGVQWLALLYENGLNGILADEMGLGKTLQTIAFLAHLKEKGVWGPFLVVCPLSVLHNWASEFEKFTPDVPVVIYHGTPEHRKELIKTRMAMPTDLGSAASTPASSRASTPSGSVKGKKGARKSSGLKPNAFVQTKASFPVVLTTYEMIIRDRNVLNKYAWSFIIIDEGHRLKNMESRLVQEVRSYPSANRLILTGTPLHNNLNELWSLLNFIMPKIFDDLSAFQAWFDPVSNHSSSSSAPSVNTSEIVTSLHSILKPFLLRRLKADVEVNLPPKKEYVLYAPLTKEQVEVYQNVIAGGPKLRQWLVKKICGLSELDKETREALEDKTGKEDKMEVEEGGIYEGIARRRGGRVNKTKAYVVDEEDDDDSFEEDEDEEYDLPRAKSDAQISREYAIKKAFQTVNNMHLQNKIMQLRKVCSHPFLFHHPRDPKTGQSVVSKELIEASGKMLLLNRLLVELFARGHKVLIFSQFTSMLDIIEDWATEFKGWDCCRIDGNTSNDGRRDEMKRFTEGGEKVPLFLLSTRAGGLGVNLVAADTVIFYDSDWNPQMDLQAQDRAHRIGQTKPVLIFRLVSAHTVETRILERAGQKRKLEALVIARGKFKAVSSRASNKHDTEAANALLELEGEKIDVVSSVDDKIISDVDLDILLDRSPDVYKERRVGWSKNEDSSVFEDVKPEAGPKRKPGRPRKDGGLAFKVFERPADELNDGLAVMD